MKVLFLTPHEVYHKGYDYFRIGNNLGIAFLAAIVEKEGHEISFLDCAAEGLSEHQEIAPDLYMVGVSNERIIDHINSYQPDLICISCQRTPQHYSLERIVQLIKTIDSDIPLAVGGTHVSGVYDQIIDQLDVDFIIRGEGEQSILYLLRHLEGKYRKQDIPGLVFYEDGKINVNKIGHILDLNKLPNPKYDIFNKELYANSRFHTACVRGNYLIDFVYSRGCPNNCSFCMASKVRGLSHRCFSIARIKEQLLQLKKSGYDEILLEDDDISVNLEISNQVFKELYNNDFHWSILSGLNSAYLTDEVVETISGLGCNRVYYPVESINNTVIEKHKKFWKSHSPQLTDTAHYIRKFIESGVEVFGGFMIGFPDETKEQILKTVDYAKFLREKCGLSVALFFVVTPYPGTQLYNEAIRLGRIYKPQNWELLISVNYNTHPTTIKIPEK